MINVRKRVAHRRRIQAILQEILNDPTIMPNADCQDLFVTLSSVEFGRTVAHIFIDVHARWRLPRDRWTELPHARYMREARVHGNDTYCDLNEVFDFPENLRVVAQELKKRLELLYTPVVRRLSEFGSVDNHSSFPKAHR
jgi:hypothetical protein